jgi:NifU-like protein involved in Fe-S cluster formation
VTSVIERARSPKFEGWLPRDAPDVGTGEAATREKDAVVRIQVRVDRTSRRIGEAVFKASGSSVAIACASITAEQLCGATVDEAREMSALTIVAELALPVEQASVAGLAVEAAKRAVDEWERKQ